MIDASSTESFSDDYRFRHSDSFPVHWEDGKSFIDFIQSTFPSTTYRATGPFNRLKAWKLKQRCGISIVPTDDLVRHLLYDSGSRTLTVFHHVTWLKAQLNHASAISDAQALDYLTRGVLPPQLLRETLYSIYRILFPLDKKSAKYARRLVDEWGGSFDPNLLVDPGVMHMASDAFEFKFRGKRIGHLENVVAHPPPKNVVVSWIGRHSSDRNVLTVAIVGVLFAALFGLLGLIVGIGQLIVSYLAWKYPS
ncbi:hypothetical protein Hte_007100 [Hypoxylon texense]